MKGRKHSAKPITGLHPMNSATRETLEHIKDKTYMLDRAEFFLQRSVELAGRYPLPKNHDWDKLGRGLVKYLDAAVVHTPRKRFLRENPEEEYYVDWGRIARFYVRAVRERHASQGLWLRDKWRTRAAMRGKEWDYRQS